MEWVLDHSPKYQVLWTVFTVEQINFNATTVLVFLGIYNAQESLNVTMNQTNSNAVSITYAYSVNKHYLQISLPVL